MAATDHSKDRRQRSLPVMPLLLFLAIPATALAFMNTYMAGVTFSGRPATWPVHVHGWLAVLWIAMLALQGWLAHTRRMAFHRVVGKSSYIVAPAVAASLIVFTHYTMNRSPEGMNEGDIRFFIYNLGMFIGFSLCWGLAIYHRKRVALHMRFMISTLLVFGTPILFRLLLNWFGWVPGLGSPDNVAIANTVLLSLGTLYLILRDGQRGLSPSPYWVVFIVNLVMNVGYFAVTTTAWWLSFAVWFADL